MNFVPLNLHVFFFATLSLIAGIVAAFFCCPALNISLQATLICCATLACSVLLLSFSHAAVAFCDSKKIISVSLVFSCFIIGFSRYSQQVTDHENGLDSLVEKICSVRGTISEISSLEHPRMKQNIILHVHELNFTPEDTCSWVPTKLCLQVYTAQIQPLMTGDVIQLDKVTIKKTTNSSFNRYLIKEKISATLFCQVFACQLISRPIFNLSRLVSDIKQAVFDRLRKKMAPQNFALFSSLFLGNRSIGKQHVRQLSDQFQQWGISHYLARSGLHLTIFTIVWHTALRLIPVSLFIKQLILILLNIIYLLFSWTSISFLRALYSFLIGGFCSLLIIRTHFLSVLTLVTFIVLLVNPMQLFFLDFQLSFALTLALAWINHLYN